MKAWRILLGSILALMLTGCVGHHMDHNPLGGPVTTITPSSSDDMTVITAYIKRMMNDQGITDVFVYWEINDALQKDNKAVYDITLTVGEGDRQRFIFGMTDGVVDMVKEIEPEAEVQCQHEAEEYEGKGSI